VRFYARIPTFGASDDCADTSDRVGCQQPNVDFTRRLSADGLWNGG
jgi:hypothetical protein